MTAEDLMTPHPATLGPQATVREALDLMAELDIRHIPIARGGELLGMISDRDLREFTLPVLVSLDQPSTASKLLGQRLGDLMGTDPISVSLEDEIEEVIDLMIDHKVGAVPVVDSESSELVGIVSYIDVLRAARDAL